MCSFEEDTAPRILPDQDMPRQIGSQLMEVTGPRRAGNGASRRQRKLSSQEWRRERWKRQSEMPIFSEDSYYNAGCGDQLHSPKNIIEGTITAIANERTNERTNKARRGGQTGQNHAPVARQLLIRRPSLRARTLASAFPR